MHPQRLDITGNKLRSNNARPISNNKLRRPESDYARQRKQYDANPRYKYDNTANMDMEMPDKTTQDFDGPGMVSRVDPILGMSINGDDGDEISFSNIGSTPSPYLHYGLDGGEERAPVEKAPKKKIGGGERGSSRPRSAVRRDDGGGESKSTRK